MNQYNFKDNIFSRFFLHYFKENDTYKDQNGQGILERFISICGEYLDESVSPDIDNLIDLIDVDKTPDIYLNLLWEYFGYIPYAYGILNGGNPYNQQDLGIWVSSKYPTVDYRAILKYAISLYKIRCTSDFYNILGKFYNIFISLQVINTPLTGAYVNYDKTSSEYDSDKVYDQPLGCLECTKITANIYIPKGPYQWLLNNNQLPQAKEAIIFLLNKYIPIHVKLFTDDDVTILEDDLYLVV